MIRKASRLMTLLVLVSFASSCAVMPLTRKYSKWSAEVCGSRSSFLSRYCSFIVSFFTLPVMGVTVLLDLPIAFIEINTGYQLVEDPLVRSTSFTFEKRTYAGNNGDQWEVQPSLDEPGYFEVVQKKDGAVLSEYLMRPLPDKQVEVVKLTPAS